MGTVVSLHADDNAPLATIVSVFAAADERFSLYRADSEASRIARGELAMTASSSEMRDAYADAIAWRTATDGAFTPHRPDGVIDLAGTVKARAIAVAGDALEAARCADWLLTVGGDILGAGDYDGAPWSIGIIDPDDRNALLCAVLLTGGKRAVATSGTAERGDHIWRRPFDPHGATFRQVSVLAGDIVTADVLATAILAGGRPSLDRALERYDVDVLACAVDGGLVVSDGLRRTIAGDP
ncbi:FAD:protein FMN transferase [Microbacteriaceae bacterium VKM Ac-2855]|nr:FAD:protein FMN transferase [Microbacteriaceae bacterium VKM Ac-2855]